jgi:hypothetical protein
MTAASELRPGIRAVVALLDQRAMTLREWLRMERLKNKNPRHVVSEYFADVEMELTMLHGFKRQFEMLLMPDSVIATAGYTKDPEIRLITRFEAAVQRNAFDLFHTLVEVDIAVGGNDWPICEKVRAVLDKVRADAAGERQ